MVGIPLEMVTKATTPGLSSLDLNWTSHRGVLCGNFLYVFENSGGPAATRTPDLYRVKLDPALQAAIAR